MGPLSRQLDRKRRQIPWALWFSMLGFWLCLGFNAWTWGALGRTAEVGGLIESNARSSSWLALTYMKTGQWTADLLQQPELGVAGISLDYAPVLAQIAVEPTAAVAHVLAHTSLRGRLLQWSHYATLPLLGLWAWFTIFRPRQQRTFGSTR